MILRERFLEHANSTNEGELRQAKGDAEKLIREGQAALACHDTWDFTDPLTVRVYMAEALFWLGKDGEARAILEPDVPPPGPLPDWRETGKLFKELPEARRRRVSSTYLRQSVAKGHVLLGEIALKQSFLAPSLDERLANARAAVTHADQSLAYHVLHDEAPLLKGKALLHLAFLLADRGATAEARKTYDEAKAVLSRLLQETSPQSEAAKGILEKAPPLETPR